MNARVIGVVVGVVAFVAIRFWQGAAFVPAFLGALVVALAAWGLMTLIRRARN